MSDWIHESSIALPAPPDRVFAALSEPAELRRWFAEHAEVEPRPGGAFRFWGRHTYGTPRRQDAGQTLLRFEPDRELAFSWTIDGVPSEVALALTPDESEKNPGGTRLAVRHALAAPLAAARGRDLVDDLWRLACGNLRAHLLGGDGVVLPDYDDPSPEIRLSIVVEAPRERVFRALLDPEILNRWIAASAVVEPRVGGRYGFGWRYEMGGRQVDGGPTRILELVENERLVTDWPDWRGDESVPVQKIAWRLEPLDGDRTRVTVVHSGFVRAADFSDYPFGWGHFLASLKRAAEPPAS